VYELTIQYHTGTVRTYTLGRETAIQVVTRLQHAPAVQQIKVRCAAYMPPHHQQ
jgi:hypothetical protein